VYTAGNLLLGDSEGRLVVATPNGAPPDVIGLAGGMTVTTILDGAVADEAWVLGDDGTSAARVRPARSADGESVAPGLAIDRFELDADFRAEATIADGLVGYDGSDRPARWSPVDGVVPLTSAPDGFLPIVATAGDLVALAEPGRGTVAVIDARADARIADVPLGDDLVTTCFSPDGRYLAARHYAADAARDEVVPALSDHVTVTDLGRETPARRRFTLAAPVGDLTWLSPTHLAVSTPDAVVLIDMADFSRSSLAELTGAAWWLLDADGSAC
jgi:hypothetical protein